MVEKVSKVILGRGVFIAGAISSFREVIGNIQKEKNQTGQDDPISVWPLRKNLLRLAGNSQTVKILGLNKAVDPWSNCVSALEALSLEDLQILVLFYEELKRTLESNPLKPQADEMKKQMGQDVVQSCITSIGLITKIAAAKNIAVHGKSDPKIS